MHTDNECVAEPFSDTDDQEFCNGKRKDFAELEVSRSSVQSVGTSRGVQVYFTLDRGVLLGRGLRLNQAVTRDSAIASAENNLDFRYLHFSIVLK